MNDGIYRHSRQVSLDTYASLPGPPAVFQTNKCLRSAPCGNVPDGFIADPESTDQDGTILVTVDGATNSYTVRYGANVVHTFPIKAAAPATAGVVIESLLPNPVGDDDQLEEVTLRNTGRRRCRWSAGG